MNVMDTFTIIALVLSTLNTLNGAALKDRFEKHTHRYQSKIEP